MNIETPSIEIKLLLEGVNDLKKSPLKNNTVKINLYNFYQKRIKFNSAFDHKGSKKFLYSKKVALEEIKLDYSDNSSNNDSDTLNESNKQKDFTSNIYPKIFINKKKIQKNNSNNLFLLSKNNELKDKTPKKARSKNKLYINRDYIKTTITKELIFNKKLKKYCSSQELKMFNDKDIKKIKPIKKTNYVKNKNERKHSKYLFIETEKSDDSSLFNIISQIK